ncbi:MAG: sialidase family protein [Aureispira sp.]
MFFLSTILFFFFSINVIVAQDTSDVKKIKDIIIYQDTFFFSSFPSIIKLPNNEFYLAFRRAPNRKKFGKKYHKHSDPNSHLMAVRSKDGENWTKEPELIYANPFGGSQDPCLLQLSNKTILCSDYVWTFLEPEDSCELKEPYINGGEGVVFLGGHIIRSKDKGKTWSASIYPPKIKGIAHFNVFGDTIPAYNRGAMYEGRNKKIYWIVVGRDTLNKTSNHLLVSEDKGLNWHYSGVVATDEKISFNEASIYETPKGDLVGFLRTAGADDQAYITRSSDGGKTFQWKSMNFQGNPLNALRLPDKRVLLTYGYRREPFGIRARILNPECTNFNTAPEIILRDDAINPDIGYTWAVQLDRKRVLVVYYFNLEGEARHIAGTILEIKPIKKKYR